MAPTPEPKKHVMLSNQNIEQTIMKVCCKKLCIRRVSKEDCEALCLCISSKKGLNRHKHLLQEFSCFLNKANDNSKIKDVCKP